MIQRVLFCYGAKFVFAVLPCALVSFCITLLAIASKEFTRNVDRMCV